MMKSDMRKEAVAVHKTVCVFQGAVYLKISGMPRHYVQELRGDSDGAAIDIYTRIDREELRRSYLACIPRLGI